RIEAEEPAERTRSRDNVGGPRVAADRGKACRARGGRCLGGRGAVGKLEAIEQRAEAFCRPAGPRLSPVEEVKSREGRTVLGGCLPSLGRILRRDVWCTGQCQSQGKQCHPAGSCHRVGSPGGWFTLARRDLLRARPVTTVAGHDFYDGLE